MKTKIIPPQNRPIIILTTILLSGLLLLTLWQSSPPQINWNRGQNGIWLQHGWLGADEWFARFNKQPLKQRLRSQEAIHQLADQLQAAGITTLFPHLAPTHTDGHLPPVNKEQTRRFLAATTGQQILPWVGGVQGKQVFADDPAWRYTFISSINQLLSTYPQFAGVHLNIEPWPSDDQNLLSLLRELKTALPARKILSVAAYPPPILWQPGLIIHWQKSYYQQISAITDQLVVMMYDTGIPLAWAYQHLLATWTREVLAWTADNTTVLLGLPAYDDRDKPYHNPKVENLATGLAGIASGLAGYKTIPANYQGICLYADWQMENREWQLLH